jgi:hypothetical protein
VIGWQIKAIAAVAVAGLIGYLVWREHSLTRKLAEVRIERDQANANYTALRTAYDHERKIAKEASDAYQKDLADLRRARTDDPLPAVVCKRPRASLPAASAAAPGSDAARPADDAGEDAWDRDERDIGPQLDDFATACEANLSQLTRLQEWVRAR